MKTLRLSADDYLPTSASTRLKITIPSRKNAVQKFKKKKFKKKFKTNIFTHSTPTKIYTCVVQLVRMLKVFKSI